MNDQERFCRQRGQEKTISYCRGSVGHEKDLQRVFLQEAGRRGAGDDPSAAECFKSPGVYATRGNASRFQDMGDNFCSPSIT